MEYNDIFDLVFSYLKKIFSPEDWIEMDISFSKSELFAIMITERYGDITMTELADYINVPMSTATGIIERLVKKGYLKRYRSESDRRIVSIKLTEKGKDLFTELKNNVMSYVQFISSSLSEEEKQLLYGLFTKIAKLLENKVNNKVKDNQDIKIHKIDIE